MKCTFYYEHTFTFRYLKNKVLLNKIQNIKVTTSIQDNTQISIVQLVQSGQSCHK